MGHGVSRVLEFHDEWFLELCLNPFWLYHIVVSRFNNASIWWSWSVWGSLWKGNHPPLCWSSIIENTLTRFGWPLWQIRKVSLVLHDLEVSMVKWCHGGIDDPDVCTPCVVCFNLNDLIEGFRGFAWPGGLYGEMVPWWNCIGDFGDSFCNVIACLCIGNLLKLVLVLPRGEVSPPFGI